MSAVVRALAAEGHEVTVWAGADARHGVEAFDGVRLEPIEPVRRGPPLVVDWTRRAVRELARLRTERVEVVLCDGDQPPLLAARLLGRPSIAIGHDLVFSTCALPAGLARASLWCERINHAPAHLAHARVAVHFLPVSPRVRGVRVARPDVRADLRGPVADDGFVLGYFRDDDGEDVVRMLRARGVTPIVFGARRAGSQARPFDRAAFAEHLRRAHAVVTSAGSNVLFECVLLGKPVLALHRRGDHEQALNAALVARAEVGCAGRFESLTERDIARFLDRARRRDFARVDVERLLPPLTHVVLETLRDVAAR